MVAGWLADDARVQFQPWKEMTTKVIRMKLLESSFLGEMLDPYGDEHGEIGNEMEKRWNCGKIDIVIDFWKWIFFFFTFQN